MKTRISSFLAASAILGASFVYMACSDDSNPVTEPPGGTSSGSTSSGNVPDAGPITFDAGKDETGAAKDCFDNPTTHFEIINACTTADRIVRVQTKSTKLLADGGLPKP